MKSINLGQNLNTLDFSNFEYFNLMIIILKNKKGNKKIFFFVNNDIFYVFYKSRKLYFKTIYNKNIKQRLNNLSNEGYGIFSLKKDSLIAKKSTEKRRLFWLCLKKTFSDKEGKLISKYKSLPLSIISFCEENGVHIGENIYTLKDALSAFDNDYSLSEEKFKNIFNVDILSEKNFFISNLHPNCSIIIPYYNSLDSIFYLLKSIQWQKNIDFSRIEVIIIDDASFIPLNMDTSLYNFPIKIIRLNKHKGSLLTRYIGVQHAKHDILIFFDSDIIISEHYIHEHIFRNWLIHNGLFLSFKYNIPNIKEIKDITAFKKVASQFSDFRLRKTIDSSKESRMDKKFHGKEYNILMDSNFFKNLGNGRFIGPYSLPNVVISNNMSCRKDNFLKANANNENFIGWGMEDVYFGAKMISIGVKVIPVLPCSIYHLDHPPRSGSIEKKFMELKKNIMIYENCLTENI